MRDSNKDYHAAFLLLSVRTSLPLNSHFNRFPFSHALYFHPLSFSFFPPNPLAFVSSPLVYILTHSSPIFFFSSSFPMYILAYRVPPWFALDLFVSHWRVRPTSPIPLQIWECASRTRARGRSPDSF